jgi:hypothetical protein
MLNSSTAKTVAGFDESINYKIESLPEDFKTKHYQHFSHTRGAGYWIWKPYIILNHLKHKMNDNDLLMYTDSGCHFINNLNPLFNRLNNTQEKVLVFNLAQIEKDWTKRDCFIKLNCDTPEFTDSKQIMSTFFLCRKNDFAINVVEQWYNEISDFHMVSDEYISPSKTPNYPSFKEHRHDQSILSLVCKKNNVEFMEDISQWGDPIKRNMPQLVAHTRKRD